MNENKQNTTLLTVIAVATLLVAVVGSTFAYFTASTNTASTQKVTTTAGIMKIVYADSTPELNKVVSTNVQPGNAVLVDKQFTVTGTVTTTAGAGLDMPYTVGMRYTNGFTAVGTGATPTEQGGLVYYIRVDDTTGVTTQLKGTSNVNYPGQADTDVKYTAGIIPTKETEDYLPLASGEFTHGYTDATATFYLKVLFPETNEPQDDNKTKVFAGYIVVNDTKEMASWTTVGTDTVMPTSTTTTVQP